MTSPGSSSSGVSAFESFRGQYSPLIEQQLTHLLCQKQAASAQLNEAMRYAVLNGGKRLRPLLALCTCDSLGGDPRAALTAGSAVEFLHSYSLVHDDLPAMDDDELRRGQPTCHIAFDEATAILAGDALQTLAFETLLNGGDYPPEQRLLMLHELSRASGRDGMVAGQMIDLTNESRRPDLASLQTMHRLKTGALIEASILLGALASGPVSTEQESCLRALAASLGLAFQIRDDIIDVESDTKTLGKTAGKDEAQQKSTYTTLLGLEGAREELRLASEEARQQVRRLSKQPSTLDSLITFVVERDH